MCRLVTLGVRTGLSFVYIAFVWGGGGGRTLTPASGHEDLDLDLDLVADLKAHRMPGGWHNGVPADTAYGLAIWDARILGWVGGWVVSKGGSAEEGEDSMDASRDCCVAQLVPSVMLVVGPACWPTSCGSTRSWGGGQHGLMGHIGRLLPLLSMAPHRPCGVRPPASAGRGVTCSPCQNVKPGGCSPRHLM